MAAFATATAPGEARRFLVGVDVGSTTVKAVAVDAAVFRRERVEEKMRNTGLSKTFGTNTS